MYIKTINSDKHEQQNVQLMYSYIKTTALNLPVYTLGTQEQ